MWDEALPEVEAEALLKWMSGVGGQGLWVGWGSPQDAPQVGLRQHDACTAHVNMSELRRFYALQHCT